jgi:uncharacterized protein (DUF169 family)
MAYGMVPGPQGPTPVRSHPYDCFEYGKYVGIVTTPLKSANFKPDVVIIYSNTSQLRSVILSLPFEEISQVKSHFFPPSCAYAVVHVMNSGLYWVILPDPGEYQRALGDEGEMMFSVPAGKIAGLLSGLSRFQNQGFAYRNHNMMMLPDFPRPDFYKQMFKEWGLEDY